MIFFASGQWVQRSVFDEAVATFNEQVKLERDRYNRLFAAYERLRVEKLANPVQFPDEAAMARIEQQHRDDELAMQIEMAIDERAQGDPGLIRLLQGEARKMLSRNIAVEEVCERILQGADYDD